MSGPPAAPAPQTAMPEVVHREFAVIHEGKTKRVSLVVEKPRIPDSEMSRCADVDVVVPWFLEQCRFVMDPKNMASAERVLMILVMHLTQTTRFQNIWKRLVGRKVVRAIAENSTWRNATTVSNGMIPFAPEFWKNIFEAITCSMNPELCCINRTLWMFSQLAEKMKIDPKTRLLPFMFIKTLSEINLVQILESNTFRQYLYRNSVDRIEALGHVALLRNLGPSPKPDDLDDLEDAWVILLSTSKFRQYPFERITASTGMIPMLTSVIAKEEDRLQALAVERARKEELADKSDLVVGEPMDGPSGGYELARRMATAPRSPPPPAYVPYTCISYPVGGVLPAGCTAAALLEEFNSFPSPHASEPKRNLLFNAVSKGSLVELRKDYCAAIGVNEMANPVVLLRSIVICMLGGEDWIGIHEKLLASLGRPPNPVEARNVLGLMSPAMLQEFMSIFDNDGSKLMPTDVSVVLQQFAGVVMASLTPTEVDTFSRDAIKMLLVIYYTQWEYAVKSARVPELATTDLWRMFGWTIDTRMVGEINRWKGKNVTLPPAIRSYAIKLAFSDI